MEEVGYTGEGSQKVQIPNYKINETLLWISAEWGCNVQHGDLINNVIYWEDADRVDLKSSQTKKKIISMCGDRC